jgi:hypothetical protein
MPLDDARVALDGARTGRSMERAPSWGLAWVDVALERGFDVDSA